MKDVTEKYKYMLDCFYGDLMLIDRGRINKKFKKLFDVDFFRADLEKLSLLTHKLRNNEIRIVEI